ncbi:MAG: rRNA processing protein Krr1/Pno1 containing KH domain [Candidatus Methanohalarchaeum thermophilum]|uniref:rRNA processing protein Krr1/Pno1 containing KH domain n=1 Tax=Methanohalarchaeum thermophilum TaxID=1903181 RepID=A0A1Q6DUE0_METT1|nr:MAG: rRNA processing protein Krr1/Pno1 containing KH domain [Candidatus Methanohalarchaeum thermophilum]
MLGGLKTTINLKFEKMTDFVKIPQDRIGVLIGRDGETKDRIEEETGVKLEVDSSNGRVRIDREEADPLVGWKVSKVVKAIGRGFSPEDALKLLEERKVMELIDITNYASTKDSLHRLKGRVIGKKGKTRKNLEEISGTNITIYGKTIGCIGGPEKVSVTAQAIKKLLNGAPHGNAYKFLKDNTKKPGGIEYIRRDH